MTNNKKEASDTTIAQTIQEQYQGLCNTFAPSMTKDDLKKIDMAFEMAWKAHKGMLRASGAPYITHPLRVAQIVSQELGLGVVYVISALLHDVPEDTTVPLEAIKGLFGDRVATVVAGLTKISHVAWYQSKQAESIQKVLRYLSEDICIILVKLADRLDNMRTLHHLPEVKRWRIALETQEIYVPIAHRLGLNKMKSELENLHLKAVSPEIYHDIASKVQTTIVRRQQNIKDFVYPIEKALTEQGITFRIEERPKSIYAIYKKLKDKNISFGEIYDLIAVRIILSVPLEQEKVACWQTYGVVTTLFKPKESRTKDWINTPRMNGYESLHLTVQSKKKEWIEVQIRTERMHQIASQGIASHWRYKEKTPNKLHAMFDEWLQEMSKSAIESDNGFKIMKHLELGLDIEAIHVFSEKGKGVTLPKGATLLDFAINIHDKKGAYCAGGVVNRQQFVPPSYVLQESDTVALYLDEKKEHTLKEKMKDIVVTPKATRILHTLFERNHAKLLTEGKTILQKMFAKYGISYNTNSIECFREFLGEEITENVFLTLAKNLVPHMNTEVARFADSMQPKGGTQTEESSSPLADRSKTVLIGADSKTSYELAKCCAPLPGDKIFGIGMANKSIRIHSLRCKESKTILSRYSSRVVKVMWYNAEPVEIELYFKAVQNNQLTPNVLSAIKSFDVQSLLLSKTTNAHIQGSVHVIIKDVKEVDALMKNLQRITGVQEVCRI